MSIGPGPPPEDRGAPLGSPTSHAAAGPAVDDVRTRTRPPRSDPGTGPRWSSQAWSWLALTALLTAVRMPNFWLWDDVRYTIGVERVTARAGWWSWEIWAHRPLLDWVLKAGLDHLSVGPHQERQLFAWGALAAGAVVWALHRQLRRRLGWVESAALCTATLAALIWAPSTTMLQPEWFRCSPPSLRWPWPG